MTRIQKIRQKIIDKNYYLSSHAEDEMYDDRLNRPDIENTILKGKIIRKLSEDIRGIRYKYRRHCKGWQIGSCYLQI